MCPWGCLLFRLIQAHGNADASHSPAAAINTRNTGIQRRRSLATKNFFCHSVHISLAFMAASVLSNRVSRSQSNSSAPSDHITGAPGGKLFFLWNFFRLLLPDPARSCWARMIAQAPIRPVSSSAAYSTFFHFVLRLNIHRQVPAVAGRCVDDALHQCLFHISSCSLVQCCSGHSQSPDHGRMPTVCQIRFGTIAQLVGIPAHHIAHNVGVLAVELTFVIIATSA